MRINKRRASLAKKINLTFDVNIFSALTARSVKRAMAVIDREIQRGYSVTISAYDWRLVLTLKRHYPSINAVLLLPDLILDPTNTAPTSAFYCRYKKSYLFYQSFYARDCDWFFTFNPKKYFMDLDALQRATGADRILLTKSCRYATTDKIQDDDCFYNYVQYSRLSREHKYPTWNHKFKSHLVSLADFYQLEKYSTQTEARQFLCAVKKAALQAENNSNNNHREGINIFHTKLNKLKIMPSISYFKSFYSYPAALNKLSDIYSSTGNIKNYLDCKKIELNHLLGIHSSTPHMLSDAQLLNAMFNHIVKEISHFKFRNDQDDKFLKLVSGKSVAIVGPAPNEEKNGKIIDSFDNVIRLRFPADDKHAKILTGKKTTIINNSLAFSRLMGDSLIYDKEIFVTYQSAIPSDNKAKAARTLFEFQNNLLTMPHAVPRNLIDILAFSPEKIKIFNTTLMLAKNGNTYTSNYHENISKLFQKNNIHYKKNLSLSFFYHDPIVNFLIMKCLFERNFFESDNNLSKILKLKINEYIELLINDSKVSNGMESSPP